MKTSKRKSPQPPLLKRLWIQDQTDRLIYSLGGGASLSAVLDGLNYYLQSSQFTTLLGYMHVPKEVYITIAVVAMLAFIAKGRNA